MALPEALSPFADEPAKAGVYTDFDGTLAPIVDDPSHARALDGAVEVLAALAVRFARVGVISGRPVSFLRAAVGDAGVDMWGEYGLERLIDGEVQPMAGAEKWRAVVDEVAGRAEELDVADLVERKSLSVTLHFRADPDREEAVRTWAVAEGERTGLEVQPARKAVELRPPVTRDKGSALADAAAGLGAACFLGDDRGDLAAFDALDRMAGEGLAVARVAVWSPEMPSELEQRADVVVDGPSGALALLEELAATAAPDS